jgi:hypothetical protein
MRFNVAPFADKVPIMGEAARGWLFAGQRGKVLVAVNHATYLLTEEGELVWLATTESPKHRRCIQWPAPLPRLAVDSTFTIRGQSIDLESGTKLNFRASHVWETPALPVGDVIGIEQLPELLFAACESFLARETPVGVGAFIRPVLQIAKKQDSSTGFQPENILTMTAWPIVERIARACLSNDFAGVLKHADALIGLGEGLTPSGDDFLGGLFFARYLLSCSFPHLSYLEFFNLPEWIDANQPRTNPISFVLLKDNAAGHALDPLIRFGIALLTNQPIVSTISAASDLIKVGHSTGWSLLTGFLVGMLLAFPD